MLSKDLERFIRTAAKAPSESKTFLFFSIIYSWLQYIFFKSEEIIRQKRCYVAQGEFQIVHQTKLFLKKNPGHQEIVWLLKQFGSTVYLDKYQT